MRFAKRLLMGFGAIALAGIVGTLLMPKATHAIVATLVSVVNNVAVVNPLDGNGNQMPLLTKDANSPARSPFDVEAVCNFGVDFTGTNQCVTSNIVSVPPGQIAKTEFTSVFCQTGSTLPNEVDIEDGGQENGCSDCFVDHFMTLPAGGLPAGRGLSQAMDFYTIGSAAAPGNNFIRALIRGDASTTGRCFVTLSGYLATQ